MHTSTLEIVQAGTQTTVQDRGRVGYQHLGIPVSGAMDLHAMRTGNILVGNGQYDACLEITLGRFEARFLKDTVFAVTGPNNNASLNGQPIPTWKAFTGRKGDRLQLGKATRGLRDYLALRGGVEVPLIMGSRSTCLKAKFGGFQGRQLKQGDTIHTGRRRGNISGERPEELIPPYGAEEIRVVLGPQESAFDEDGLETFARGTYEVTDHLDRMGARLSGPIIRHAGKADIISDGVAFGAIQVPGNGQPLVLLADRPTTGGYTKIATVVAVDIPVIAQAMPGSRVQFKTISFSEARELYLRNEFQLRRFLASCGSSGE